MTISPAQTAVVLRFAVQASAAATGGCQFKSIYLTSLPSEPQTTCESRPPAEVVAWLRAHGGLN